MNYYDITDGLDKRLCSMAFPDKTGNEEVYFYEILKEFEDFPVLSKKDQLKTHVRLEKNSYHTDDYDFAKVTQLQYEEFYFLSKEGRLEIYLSLLYKKVKAKVYGYRSEKIQFSNADLLPKYLATYWPAVEQYLHNNRIKLNRKENILKALNYYEKLLQN